MSRSMFPLKEKYKRNGDSEVHYECETCKFVNKIFGFLMFKLSTIREM